MPEENINLLPSAVALGIKGVIKPKNFGAPHVPSDVLTKAKKRFADYQSVLKKNRHASFGNKIKRKWQGHDFDARDNPKERERLNNLLLAFLDIRSYLSEAVRYFDGCVGVDVLKSYQKTVDEDYRKLNGKNYVGSLRTQYGGDRGRYEALRGKRQADRSNRIISKRFPKEKYNVIGLTDQTQNLIPQNMRNQIRNEDNYITRVQAIYKIAYNWFGTILSIQAPNARPGAEHTYVLQRIAMHYLDNSPIRNTTARTFLKKIDDTINHFSAQQERLMALKNKFFELSKGTFQNKFTGVEKTSLSIKNSLYTVQSSAKLNFVGLSSSVESAEKNTWYGIYDDVIGIPKLMTDYIDDAKSGSTSTDIQQTYTELFVALKHLEDDVNKLNTPQLQNILGLQQNTKTALKNISKLSEHMDKASQYVEKLDKAINNLDEKIQSYEEHKKDVKRAWITFGIGSALGLVQSSLNPITTLLTTAKKDIGVEPLV